MTTQSLLKDNDILAAVIVDDAYDGVPRAGDLSLAEDAWFNFFDDLNNEDRAALADLYPEFDTKTEVDLRTSDAFVATLWNRRNDLRPGLTDSLFETYKQDLANDERFLGTVEVKLADLGLTVSKAGRNFVQLAKDSDLIVIDLFLGSSQSEANMEVSIKGLKEIVEERGAEPPIIVLMSRSSQLTMNAEKFRDQTHVFASGFRMIKKSDLNRQGRLEQLLLELARHRRDSLKLTYFSKTWQAGLSDAVERTASDIRRLDLEDWTQIRDLLLTGEEVSTGSYILDVFDLVLQHEIESDQGTIEAARDLDSLQSESYPPSTVTGSKDTIALVFKTLYQHENRRRLDEGADRQVAFGDILGLVDEASPPLGSVFAGEENTVFLVMTPACDLQRRKARRVLLMAGTFKSLDANVVDPVSGAPRSVVLKLASDRRVCVDWKPHHLAALSYEELKSLLADGGGVRVVGRLRDVNAVSLQQQLLSNIGRVGLVSPMPLTFQVEVRVFHPNLEGELTPLLIDGHDRITGVCFVGRDSSHKVVRALFDSDARFSLLHALSALEDDAIHRDSLDKIQKSRAIEVVDFLFSKGVKLDVSKTGPQDWKAPVGETDELLGKILYNMTISESWKALHDWKRTGLVFEVVAV